MALAAWIKGMLEDIRWGERHRHPLLFGEFVQLICAVYDARGHQVNDSLSAPLHLALHQHQPGRHDGAAIRSEEHTSELQSLMRSSYAVFCLKKKNTKKHT